MMKHERVRCRSTWRLVVATLFVLLLSNNDLWTVSAKSVTQSPLLRQQKQHLLQRVQRSLPWKKKNLQDNDLTDSTSTSTPPVGGVKTSAWTRHRDAYAGAIVLTLIERGVNKLFKTAGISFPATLGGCLGLFAFLLFADAVRPGWGVAMYEGLLPGSTLLAKWFPVLFVPSLVMLPLASSIGNAVEVVKFLGVALFGFIYSLSTTAFAVLALRVAQGAAISKAPVTTTTTQQQKPVPTKPYDAETMQFLIRATVLSGIMSILATNTNNPLATPIRTVFLFLTTFAAYVWGARLPSQVTKFVHPVITSTILILSVVKATSQVTGSDFLTVLKTYKVGNLNIMKTGAADIMLFLLGPCVVSFATSMFSRRQLLKENFAIVILSALVASIGGLFGTAGMVRLLQLGGPNGRLVRLSTLPRNVTTALAMACIEILGGDMSLTVLIVVITGVLGATYGRPLLDAMGIYDPVARGLAVGGSAQGLGVAGIMAETDAYPFAAMAMILTAISATILVFIPPVKEALVNICQG